MEARICFIQTEIQIDAALRDISQLSAFLKKNKLICDGISVFQ